MTAALPTQHGQWCNACGTTLATRDLVRLSMGGDDPTAQYYCAPCADRLLRCAVCDKGLDTRTGPLYALGGPTRRLYCPDCWARPHCHACGRPVGAEFYRRPDGRVFCAGCHATAVYDPAVAEQIYARIRHSVATVLGIELNIGATLHLVNRTQITALRAGVGVDLTPPPPSLQRKGESTSSSSPPFVEDGSRERSSSFPPFGGEGLGGGSSPNPQSAIRNPQSDSGPDLVGLFVHAGRLRAIYVEYGLPRIFFSEVLAHEYAHAWQAENAPLLADPELREGFAEWVAYKTVESWGCRLRLDRFRERQDTYGAGLRRVLGWEATGGVAEVLERIRRER